MATWMQVAWSEEADAAIGPQIAGHRQAILRRLAENRANLYRVEAANYAGWLLLEMHDTQEGPHCNVITIQGRGMVGPGLDDLKRILAK